MAGVTVAAKRRTPHSRDDLPSPEHIKRVKKERRETIDDPGDTQPTQDSSSSTSDSDESESESDNGVLAEQDLGSTMTALRASREQYNKYAGELRDAGVIKSITLTDFMCHRHMTADFGGKMNFVVGHNGSGKSAILTGIAVALGGKASITGRGRGIKDLVREGADKAVIILTLANSGTEAHKPELFNPNIVIERTITRTGQGSWRFRASRDGKSVGDKRQLLTDIVEAFQIHVDSPLTILTQDQARSFLQSSDPASLYKFFMQGTLLQSLVDSYQAMNDKVKELKRIHTAEKEGLPALQQVKDRLYSQEQSSRQILRMRTEADECNKELGWAYVSEKEKDVRDKQDQVEAQVAKIEQARAKITEEEGKVAERTEAIQHLDRKIKDLQDGQAPITQRKKKQRDTLDKLKAQVAGLEDDSRACQDSADTHKREVQHFDDKIRAQGQTASGKDPEIDKLREKVNEYTGGLHNLKRQKPKLEQAHQLAEEAVTRAEEAVAKAEGEWSQAQQDERDGRSAVDNLRAQATDRLAAFGTRMDLVMSEIDRARWIHSKPIGPLGRHVKLKDMRYQTAFQRLMGSFLCQFAVRCDQDKRTMLDILKRCGQRGYKVGSSAPHRQAPHMVQTHAGDIFSYAEGDLSHINATILSILEIDNEDVKRLLINQFRIEKTFIWPLVKGPTGVSQRSRELLRGGLPMCNFVTADGFQSTAYAQPPSEQSGPLPRYDGNIVLTNDVTSNIEDQRKKHALLVAKTGEAKHHHQQAQTAHREAVANKAEATRKLVTCNNGIEKFETQLVKFQDKLDELQTGDTGVDYTEARNEAYKKQLGQEAQLEGIQEQITQRSQMIAETEVQLRATEDELENLAPETIQATEELTFIARERQESKNNADFYSKRIATYETQRKSLQTELDNLTEELDRWTTEATRISHGVRMQSNRTVAEIERRRVAAEQSIARAERETGTSVQDITQRLKAADEKLELATETVKQMAKLATLLDRTISNRRNFWKQERGRNSLAAMGYFIANMEKRDMEGQLSFDHDQSELHIKVRETGLHTQMSEDGEVVRTQRQYKTPKTMSGGERSFTTVSLLLAMWELSPGPMRCLDEWDVFLDSANRGVAAQMLLDGAKASDGTQYLLITPLNMNGIEVNGPGNKVIRMADPVRNQGTLPFRPA